METLFVGGVLAVVLTGFWLVDRRRIAGRLEDLSDRHQRLESMLNGFIDESEKLSVQFSRLLTANRAIPAAPRSVEASGMGGESFPQARINGVERKHLVLRLAQKGRSVSEIAERLMIPGGEVELILNLNRPRRSAGLTTSA